jgi:hypothetical protein
MTFHLKFFSSSARAAKPRERERERKRERESESEGSEVGGEELKVKRKRKGKPSHRRWQKVFPRREEKPHSSRGHIFGARELKHSIPSFSALSLSLSLSLLF